MKRFLSISLLILAAFHCVGQEIRVYKDSIPGSYSTLVYTPEGYMDLPDSAKACKPLVLFLHGGSLIGNNLMDAMRYGPLHAVRSGRDIDAVILNPQTPGTDPGAIGSWDPEKLIKLLDWTKERFPYDADRVYVLGMSIGGFGTLNFVNAHPERVAAAMALCGGCKYKTMEGLAEVPLWIIHGTADRQVNIHQSQRVYDWLVANGKSKRVIFDILVGYDHSSLARYFYMQMTYDWLFSHSKKQEGHPVNRRIMLQEPTYRNAYYSDKDSELPGKVKIINPGK